MDLIFDKNDKNFEKNNFLENKDLKKKSLQ
jgi:hypothetical protein